MKRFLTLLMALIIITSAAQSQTQSDTSDAVWSIVVPQPASQDIDMKQVLVGETKDSVVAGFVRNTGSWKFRVDSIYFRGVDAPFFGLVSGFPKYEINAGLSNPAEFRFSPKQERSYTAEVVIITQADTLYQNIIGEGVKPKLQLTTNFLDFGKVEVGNESLITDTVLITNISNELVDISNTVQLPPDIVQFEIVSGGGKFTLQPRGGTRELTVKFKPRFGGRTTGRLGFQYNGTGSPAEVLLYGEGIGGLVKVNDDSAYAGESRNLVMVMQNIKPEGIMAIAPNFEATIKFQNTIIYPVDRTNVTIINDSVYIKIDGKFDANNNIIAEIPVIAALGSVEETSVDITDIHLKDDLGTTVEYDFETLSGTFKLLGLCREGGTRLLNPNTKISLLSVSPNPSDDNINIELSLTEQGNTEIILYNIMGEKVETIFSENVNEFHHRSIIGDLSDLSSGQYLLILRTPTYLESRRLTILR